jgi:hypothetical protein
MIADQSIQEQKPTVLHNTDLKSLGLGGIPFQIENSESKMSLNAVQKHLLVGAE